jgi:hypothetical protein
MKLSESLHGLSEQIQAPLLSRLIREHAAEVEKMEREIDEALSVLREPDSTNNGGRANIADAVRTYKHNTDLEIKDMMQRYE